ncbi:MAG TPA: hypothetical protein VJ825_12535 [Gemmatimonadaceae bacterium]|nr:hypothetical protein [Gemmatimonadaceae bacterium]
MERIVHWHIYEERIPRDIFTAILVAAAIIPSGVVIRFGFADAVGGASAIELELPENELNFLDHQLARFPDNQVCCDPVGGAGDAHVGRERQLNWVSVSTGHVA